MIRCLRVVMTETGNAMHRIASIILIALVLVACGGGDDDDDDSSSSSSNAPATTSSSGATAPAVSTVGGSTGTDPTATSEPEDEADTENAEGAPTHASSDFPDVQAPLEVGSSGEVVSMDPGPEGATDSREENSRVTVTINEILDPVEIEGPVLAPEPGNRWFGMNITMEATGSEIANTGDWTLTTTDGTEYTNLIVLGSTPDITYGSIEPGATAEGLVVFEIPEDAEVQWVLMSPTIFLGGNLVFVNS